MSPRSDNDPQFGPESFAEDSDAGKTRRIPSEAVPLDISEMPTPVKARVDTAELTPPPMEETPAPFSLAPDPGTEGEFTPKRSIKDYIFSWVTLGGMAAGAVAAAAALFFIASPFGSKPELLIHSSPSPLANLEGSLQGVAMTSTPAEARELANGLLARDDFPWTAAARDFVSKAGAIETLDISGDGAWDIAVLRNDGRGALIDGATGAIVLEGSGQLPSAQKPATWRLGEDRLVLVYPHDGTGETRMTWKLGAAARENGALLARLWSARTAEQPPESSVEADSP